MAALDAVVNNADRKGGHVLPGSDGRVYGIDHGLTFNVDDKLRTVLWGWAGEPLADDVVDELDRLAAPSRGPWATRWRSSCTGGDPATRQRPDTCAATGSSRYPGDGWPSLPWPRSDPARRIGSHRGRPGRHPTSRGCPGPGWRCGCSTPPRDRCAPPTPGPTARMYVCGITPYDATHMGHAATYVAFDPVQRVWRDAGHDVRYVQNVTDVDDPLLERASPPGRTGAASPTARPRCSATT